MGVIAIANHSVQKWAQDSHSAFNEEKRFEPEVDAVAKNADEDGNCDWKYHEQPDVVEQTFDGACLARPPSHRYLDLFSSSNQSLKTSDS